MKNKKKILLLCMVPFIISCKNGKIKDTVASLQSHPITIHLDRMECRMLDRDTIYTDSVSPVLRLVTYSSMEYDDDACALMDGFEDVATTYGVKTERTHVCDTIDSEIDYSYIFCFAEGRGKRMGYNGYVDVSPSEPKNVKCTNDHVLVFF